VVLEYILAGIMERVSISPRTTKKITAVSPMETAMGKPIMIKPTSTIKMAAVIMDFSSLSKMNGSAPPNTQRVQAKRSSGYASAVFLYFFRASSTYFMKSLTFSSPAYFPIRS